MDDFYQEQVEKSMRKPHPALGHPLLIGEGTSFSSLLSHRERG
jgi:hypothetical protein